MTSGTTFQVENTSDFVTGAVQAALTVVVERRIDLGEEGIDFGSSGAESIRMQHATDLMDLVLADRNLGGLCRSIDPPTYEAVDREPGTNNTGVILTFTVNAAWDYGSSTTRTKVPRSA